MYDGVRSFAININKHLDIALNIYREYEYPKDVHEYLRGSICRNIFANSALPWSHMQLYQED